MNDIVYALKDIWSSVSEYWDVYAAVFLLGAIVTHIAWTLRIKAACKHHDGSSEDK